MSIDIAANPYKQDFPLLAANPGLAFLDIHSYGYKSLHNTALQKDR